MTFTSILRQMIMICIWIAMQLIEKKQKLQEKIAALPSEQLKEYIVVDEQLQELQKYLFGEKEQGRECPSKINTKEICISDPHSSQ